MREVLLKISDLSVTSNKENETTTILNNIDLTIHKNETVGLIGETGCGKSMLGWALMDLLPDGCVLSGGNITYDTTPIYEMTSLRGSRVTMIFQEPMQSLNPTQTIGKQMTTIVEKRGLNIETSTKAYVKKWLARVQLDSVFDIGSRYPHQLSGGQMQRVMIALAMSMRPKFIIADEITTGLDANIKLEMMDLLFSLQDELGVAVLLISHDLATIRRYCDRVAVMRSGEVLVEGRTDEVFLHQKDKYIRTFIDGQERSNRKIKTDNTEDSDHAILSIRGLHKSYGDNKSRQSVVNNVSMNLYRGKTLGLIGESGSGKSTIARMILNILERDSGKMKLSIDGSTTKNLTSPNKKIGAVLQDSTGSLNPKMNIQNILSEPLELVGVSNERKIRSKINKMIKSVGLNEDLLTRYPYSLSGGQRQRVSLARAMMIDPRIIILDEPTSALDVKVQKNILELLKSLQKQKNLSYLFISHDLPVISEIADDVAVLYGGEIVEVGTVEKILNNPEQDYTKKLIKASTWTGPLNA